MEPNRTQSAFRSAGMSENNKKTGSSFRQVLRSSPTDFWRLWYVGLVVSTVRWLETVVMGIVVYQQTGSALLVAMVTMLRLVLMGLFGAFLGAFAERFDRRLTLAGIVGLMTVTSALLVGLVLALLGNLKLALARRPEQTRRSVGRYLTLLNLLLVPLILLAGVLVDLVGVRAMLVTGSVLLALAFISLRPLWPCGRRRRRLRRF